MLKDHFMILKMDEKMKSLYPVRAITLINEWAFTCDRK